MFIEYTYIIYIINIHIIYVYKVCVYIINIRLYINNNSISKPERQGH